MYIYQQGHITSSGSRVRYQGLITHATCAVQAHVSRLLAQHTERARWQQHHTALQHRDTLHM